MLAGITALTLGMIAAPPALAQARAALPVVNHHAAVSWGLNSSGQLGNGTTTSSALCGPVSGLGTGVVQVSAGFGFGLAMTSAGTVWAWGNNDAGQLGDGTRFRRLTPVQVKGLASVIQVAAGGYHSMALRSDGTVWAWGDNEFGQLGNGTTSTAQVTPVQVSGLTGVTKIAAGGNFSLALRSNGTVWAWGDNDVGQLGDGVASAPRLTPVQVTGLSQVTSISAGDDHSLATRTNSITALTSIWAWGGNEVGQLGDGTQANNPTPEQVTGITAPSIAGIAAGTRFSEALGSDGSVWGWGDDTYEELGFYIGGTPIKSPTEAIGAGSPITQLSAGDHHTLAVESNGIALAWGWNANGELGNGIMSSQTGSPPVQASGLTGASQVSAGGGFSLAVYLPPQYR
jgi:alpha-tubulin suppressor-like RCC1 family protein